MIAVHEVRPAQKNAPPTGETREWFHRHDYTRSAWDDEDEEFDCHGCSKCSDPECPACKGHGRVIGGCGSWRCGCTYELPGSPEYANRIARDVEHRRYAAPGYSLRVGDRPYTLNERDAGRCRPMTHCRNPRGSCVTEAV